MHTTIITVNHDAIKFIELCIKSVHLFTRLPYTHVVIDNGSKKSVLSMLRKYEAYGWIRLIERSIPKTSAGHADSLDWFLHNNTDLEYVCLLDSDAYPAVVGWLQRLHNQMDAVDATGFPHFRDPSLIHPSCMLYKYSAYCTAGRPSFRIMRESPTVFNDTGMLVCKKMRDQGCIVRPMPRINKYVKHRWCGTRIEVAGGDCLDEIPKSQFFRDTRRWFNDPEVIEILKHDIS